MQVHTKLNWNSECWIFSRSILDTIPITG
jgi:hypothetical protein